MTLAEQAGYQYLQHVIALLAAVRDSALLARPSLWQLHQNRQALDRGEPASLLIHEDVLVFAKPATSGSRPAPTGVAAEAERSSLAAAA